jgi:hypothetical protein
MVNPKVRFNATYYLKDLRALRNNLKNTRKYGGDVRGKSCFLEIDVYDGDLTTMITVIMRRSSLYLHAFRNAQTTIYFDDSEAVEDARGTRSDKLILLRDNGITYDPLTYSSHYSSLGAFPSRGLDINGKSLSNAVQKLASIDHNFDSKAWKQEVIGPLFAIIVIAVSEATRFGTIAGRIEQSLKDLSKPLNTLDIKDKVQNWDKSELTDTDVAIRNA